MIANIWNTSDDESYEEEPTSKDSILYSENICFVISNLMLGTVGSSSSL